MTPLFHNIVFPKDIAIETNIATRFETDIVTLASGEETRNSRWKKPRRTYDAGYGVTSFEKLRTVAAFFEARKGPLYGFLFFDPLNHSSNQHPQNGPTALDQVIATGDGTTRDFQLIHTSGVQGYETVRTITKPIEGTVTAAINAVPTPITVDHNTGLISFDETTTPAAGDIITAGYEFYVPVRFATDQIDINLSNFKAGIIPSIPMIELV